LGKNVQKFLRGIWDLIFLTHLSETSTNVAKAACSNPI